MESAELKQRTLHATFWMAIQAGTTNILAFCVFTVLARELSPHDFGVFALSIVTVDLARIVSNAGLSDAITRDKERDPLLADTAFWANLALGCLAGGVIWLLAPAYAALIDEPAITPVMHCLAVIVPVSSLSSIHTACNLREFGHRAFALRIVSGNVLAGGAAVAAALSGWGVWSLVIQTALMELVGIGFAWLSYPWLPSLRLDWRRLRSVCGFSGTMMLTQLLGVLLTRIQDIVIGRYISVAAVGTYRIAWRMIDLISQTTIQPMVGVSFVTLSKLQGDRDRFRSAFLRMLGLGALLTFPAIAGFGVLSGELIPLLFGAKWASSAPVARILAVMAVPFCMNFFIVPALAALGRSTSIAKGAVVQTSATLVFALLAAPFGLPWVAAAYVMRAFLTMPYHLALFRQATGIGAISMMRAIRPPFLASVAMTIILLALRPALARVLGNGAEYIAVSVLLGCMAFAGSLLLFARNYVKSNIHVLLPVFQRFRESESRI